MKQEYINTDLFASITLHRMLLEEITCAMLVMHSDKGEKFMREIMDGLRYKMSAQNEADLSAGVEPIELQKSALIQAESFFDNVRTTLSRY